MKIRLLGAELFHADRRTDGHDEANIHFSQFPECAYKCVTRINNVLSKRNTPVTEGCYMQQWNIWLKSFRQELRPQLTRNLMSCRHTNANGSPQTAE